MKTSIFVSRLLKDFSSKVMFSKFDCIVFTKRIEVVARTYPLSQAVTKHLHVTFHTTESTWFKMVWNVGKRRSSFMKLYDPYNVCFSYCLNQKSKCGSPSNKLINTLIEKDHLGDWSPEKDCC